MIKNFTKLISFVFLILSISHIQSEDNYREEIILKLSECIVQKKVKKISSEQNENTQHDDTNLIKNNNSCSKENINEYLHTIISYSQDKKIPDIYIFIAIFTILITLSIIIYRQNKLINELYFKIHSLNNEKPNNTNPELNELSLKILNLQARQAGIEDTTDLLLNKYNSLLSLNHNPSLYSMDVNPIFYMTFPKSDGTFLQSSKRNSKDSTSYIFTPINDNNAYFELSYDKDMLGRILNGPDIYIEPVCDSINEINFSANQITTLEKGQAIKEGNIWRITKKAIIRYD